MPLSSTIRYEAKDTMRYHMLEYLRDHGECSISELGRHLKYPLANVREKLDTAERQGHVKGETKRAILPTGTPVIIHAYTILEAGRNWLLIGAQR